MKLQNFNRSMILLLVIFYYLSLTSYSVIGYDEESPSILNVTHSPAFPSNKDNITIFAEIYDESGIGSAYCIYRINNDGWKNISMENIYLSNYHVQIGPFPHATKVEYYIQAVDNSVKHNYAINDNNGTFFSFTVDKMQDNSPPKIENVNYRIEKTNEELSVTVNANIYDESNLKTVNLYYKFDQSEWISSNMNFVNDTLYKKQISPIKSSYKSMFFYIEAIDNSINENKAIADNGSLYEIALKSDDLNKPLISSVFFKPVNPTDKETITISVKVSDETGISNIVLIYFYKLRWFSKNMLPSTRELYQCEIGPFNEGDVINFYIKAVDNSSHRNIAIDNNNNKYYSIVIKMNTDTVDYNSNIICSVIFIIMFYTITKDKSHKNT
ncbi:MAG: hypothetical protein K9W46_03960 [Candidatus Heimdallarchaeum endolithica]|uniref:Ig-like domain-containing protein n=1 Tax=Candidatus Heimdallarchaeum endolithica TaxID=2876572 RepID=A0A9Y1BSP6_9ARCH|nr:MAG: hypothetical protein K9W46_03960 [Candidatus Heimdallarchaeum endolithica]